MRVTPVLLVAACWTSASDRPAAPVIASAAPPPATCEDVARSLARAIGNGPERYVPARCRDDRWSDAARVCFARMKSIDDLEDCGERLDDDAREQLFRAIDDAGDERVTVAIAVARLRHTRTDISECTDLARGVRRALRCSAIPLSDRMLLYDMVGDFTATKNHRLRARFADLCTKSLADVKQQTAAAGCAP